MSQRKILSGNALKEIGFSPATIKKRGLPRFEEAQALEIAEVGSDHREHFLTPEAARAWRRMKGAGRNDGIQIFIVSAFRSIERQKEIVLRKRQAGMATEAILRVTAPPGYSEHHTGRAVDIGTPGVPVLDLSFKETAAFAWLEKRAEDFGFLLSYPENNPAGFDYEPWHWSMRVDLTGS